MAKKKAAELLEKFARAEQEFLKREFLAPVVRGRRVQVQIEGVRLQLSIEPVDFSGWGVFKPHSHQHAQLVRTANLSERQRYLAMFTAVSLILARRVANTWEAVAGQGGNARITVEGAAPVALVEDAELFDTIRARFDGTQFWFDCVDENADAGAAVYLRESLLAMVQPAELNRKGLSVQQQRVYLLNFSERLEQQARRAEAELRKTGEYRLRAALEHGGASLREFTERDDHFRVTYSLHGRTHTSLVNKRDLTVQTAGICLSGMDRDFDLASLVGVLREGGY